jgi:hypothetical protein
MKIALSLMTAMLLWLTFAGQSQQTVMKIDTSRESVLYWNNWLTDLFQMGVESTKDSFFVREEVVRMMKDSAYRKTVYPAQYNWPAVVHLLQQMQLKKAFWHLINLYQADTANRKIILGTLFLYDSLMDMDKALLSSYYTYAFTDPRVYRLKNNKPDIYRPDILEKGLQATREIIDKIWMYRKQRNANNHP